MGIFEDLNTQTFEDFNIQTFQELSKFLDIFREKSFQQSLSKLLQNFSEFLDDQSVKTINHCNGAFIQFKFQMIPIIWPAVLETVILYACVHGTR